MGLKLLATFVLISLFNLCGNSVVAQTLCAPSNGYVVGFFNGVWNTRNGAKVSLDELKESLGIGNEYRGEPVTYELFYNQTGTDRPGVSFLEDIAEVFAQRTQELDQAVANHWELFWELLEGAPNQGGFFDGIAHRIVTAGPEFEALLTTARYDLVSRAVQWMAFGLSSPPTIEDYAVQFTRLQAIGIEKKKMLFIAHSQGNLFANKAYDSVRPLVGRSGVSVVHIAPASPTLRGPHTLADNDVIINSLRTTGMFSIPPVTVSIPLSHLLSFADPTGHTLVDTYLRPTLDPLYQVLGNVAAGMNSLFVEPMSDRSAFSVTLTWDGRGDVDLHGYEPSGSHVYYLNRRGTSGYLDYDNTFAYGPEHYYASCNPTELRFGTYSFGINHFYGATGRTATIQVAANGRGEILTRRLNVGPERRREGNDSPMHVVHVSVSQRGDGMIDVNAE